MQALRVNMLRRRVQGRAWQQTPCEGASIHQSTIA